MEFTEKLSTEGEKVMLNGIIGLYVLSLVFGVVFAYLYGDYWEDCEKGKQMLVIIIASYIGLALGMALLYFFRANPPLLWLVSIIFAGIIGGLLGAALIYLFNKMWFNGIKDKVFFTFLVIVMFIISVMLLSQLGMYLV